MSTTTFAWMVAVGSLAALAGCSGGTDSGPIAGPGPGPGEPSEPDESGEDNPFNIGPAQGPGPDPDTCNGCGTLLTGAFDPDLPFCEGSEAILAQIAECACQTCATECTDVCGGGGLGQGCATCVDQQCPGALQECAEN